MKKLFDGNAEGVQSPRMQANQFKFSTLIPCDIESAQAAIDGACWEVIDNEIGTEYEVTATKEGIQIGAADEVLFSEVVETAKFELAQLSEE